MAAPKRETHRTVRRLAVRMIGCAATSALACCGPALAQVKGRQALSPAEIDETLQVQGDELAAVRVRTRLALDVAIDGHAPFRFLVDSGADRTVLGSELAQKLALASSESITLHSLAGPSVARVVEVDRLDVGPSTLLSLRAPVLPERFLGAQGILGIDALAGRRLMLDFENGRIVIQDAHRAAPREDGDIVVTARTRRGQLILTQVEVAGIRTLAIIDTGAEVTIGNAALRQALAKRRGTVSTPTILISVTGQQIDADSITAGNLRIASLELEKVTVAFADVAPFRLFGVDDRPALLLGTDILEAFRKVSLDFSARKVRFQLRDRIAHGQRGRGAPS